MRRGTVLLFFFLCVVPGYGQIEHTPPDTMYWSGDMVVGRLEVNKSRSRSFFADQDSSVVLLGYSYRPDVTRGEAFGTFVNSQQAGVCSYDGILYGVEKCFSPVLFQVLHSDGKDPYIHLSFGRSSYSGGVNTTDEQAWGHLVKYGALHIDGDTLWFRDGIRMDIENDDFCYGMIGTGICWKNTGIVWNENDIVSIGISSRRFFDIPKDPAALRVWNDSSPGTAWLSWRISAIADPIRDSVAEQLRLEVRQGVRYEYRTLRDGDAQWQTVQLEETETDSVDVFPTGLGHYLRYPRRKYLVTGLDPGGEYSFCIRAANDTGPSDETCNLDVVYPVSVEDGELSYMVRLGQNYPNPFNPSTEILYELFSPGHVRLEVFDMTGRSVGVLSDGVRPAGQHTERFDASGLPTGMYVYRLTTGVETLTRIMTLVR